MTRLYNGARHLPPLGRSDHQCILLTPLSKQPAKAFTRTVRDFKPDNLRTLGLKLNLESWDKVFQSHEVDTKVENFNKIIKQLLDTYTPLRPVRMHSSDREWITPHIKKQIQARQRAYAKRDDAEYRHLRTKVTQLIAGAKRKFYLDKVHESRYSNPSKWYKNISALSGAKQQSSTPTAPTNAELVGVANDLLKAFTAPWKDREPTAALVSELAASLEDRTPPIPNIGQVKVILKHLNPKKATGSDGVPAWLLKRFYEEMAPVIHDIICASIQQCRYPTEYKHALISPVPKVNNPVDINNDFRQISVLPQVAKVLEKVQLSLNKDDLKINTTQHAFTQNKSTVTALTSITQEWYNATDTNSSIDGVHVVFVDFRKAFDLVDHAILLTKLAAMGVSKGFWKWVQSFLMNRTLQVKLPGVLSKPSQVIAGVPQGGVISPTLFNVHVNDIEENIPSDLPLKTCKYADDCTQYQLVSSNSGSRLQDAMNHLETWAEKNKMQLNAKKTKEMWISFKKSCHAPDPVNIGGTELERVSGFKLLGVHIRNDLKWNTHVSSIVSKASKRMFHVRACRKANLPSEVGLSTFTTKIRPLLEYASPIWGGLSRYLVDDLQRVQDRCLDIIGLPRDTLESLEQRRDDQTRKELERIRKCDSCSHLISKANINTYQLRSKVTKPDIKIPMSYTERHRQSFIPRAIKLIHS